MLKILMDFDGVFTDPREEGARCQELFDQGLVQMAGLDAELAGDWLAKARKGVEAEPTRFGWRNHGRVSAFGVEDPFIRSQGLGDWLDHAASGPDANAVLRAARERLVTNGIASFFALSGHAFNQMSKERIARGGPVADPEAVASVKRWLSHECGHSVVVVSNSDPAKLAGFFQSEGLALSEHFRLVGGAGKFELSGKVVRLADDHFVIGGTEYPVDRPKYQTVLEAERPDAVIGDCLSLDLSLPVALHARKAFPGETAFSRGIFLRRRAYTPELSLDAIRAERRARPSTPLRCIEQWSEIDFSV